jgi:hypothetical protein
MSIAPLKPFLVNMDWAAYNWLGASQVIQAFRRVLQEVGTVLLVDMRRSWERVRISQRDGIECHAITCVPGVAGGVLEQETSMVVVVGIVVAEGVVADRGGSALEDDLKLTTLEGCWASDNRIRMAFKMGFVLLVRSWQSVQL